MSFALVAYGLLGVLTEVVSSFAATMAAVTGVAAASARSLAVLGKLPPERIESITAIGFVAGAIATISVVCIDFI
jgi:hypothetical protein